MSLISRRYFLSVALVGSGCLTTHAAALPPRPSPSSPCHTHAIVIDGAGNFQCASHNFGQVVKGSGLCLEVEPFVWSHGYLRVFADLRDHDHTCAEGRRLAGRILALREERPGQRLIVIAHSAGAGVALAAARCLPPDTVDRIVLLGPALSHTCDLRPLLNCSRQGVDVFYSQRDWYYLGVSVTLLGTADRCWQPAAGRVGFFIEGYGPEEGPLLAKLRQYPWHPCVAWTGNKGGHYGCYHPEFLRAYVLPLLDKATCCGNEDGRTGP